MRLRVGWSDGQRKRCFGSLEGTGGEQRGLLSTMCVVDRYLNGMSGGTVSENALGRPGYVTYSVLSSQ